MKSQVTIVIPTHERHDLLSRSIEYYKSWDAFIVIVDSSLKKCEVSLTDNFTYLHCPLTNFGDKLNIALTHVSTDYVVMSADDDFLAKNGIRQGIEFLEESPEYVSVQGNIISFYQMESKVIYKANPINFNGEGDTPLTRIRDAFSPYFHEFYALHRKINLEKCLEITKGIIAITPVEIAITLVSAARGKHKILPIFWRARDTEIRTNYNEDRNIPITDGIDSMSNPGHSVLINDWENYLSSKEGLFFKKQFVECISHEKYQGAMLFDLAFSSYIKSQKDKKIDYLNIFILKLAKLLKKIIPSQLYKKIWTLYTLTTYSKNRFSSRHMQGYPHSSKLAENDWKMISSAIITK